MNPYQQIPVGIPVSQNPYSHHPYTKNFPEEPESEAPQVSHNDQQYYPSQEQLPISQPVQFYAAGQPYDPSSQYMMVGNPVTSSTGPTKKKLERKIRDIDAKLEKGWYNAYYNWLYFLLVYSGMMAVQSVMSIVVLLVSGEFVALPVIIGGVLGVAMAAWTMQQAFVLKNAINGKNLEGARRGLKSMNIYAIGYFVAFIVFIILTEVMKRDLNGGEDGNWVVLYLVMFVFGYAVPIWINIFGAKQVIKILENREALALECKTKFGVVSNVA